MQRQVVYLLMILVLAAGCTSEAERKQMRSGLDSLNTRNRNDQPFTVQDVEPYVRFFDDHGTADDRLLAHYLLGRAYYDHGEAPMALQCYHDAIDCADTTLQDFDYAQLSRVYGQMAQVFYYQGLYRQQLQYNQLSVKYAWRGGDTLAAFSSYEQESFAYKELGLTDSAIFVTENVAKQYAQHGYMAMSATALGGIVRTLIDRGEYAKARRYMDIYDSKSGLMDKNGDIRKGKEVYYYCKGLLFLKMNQLDSAEYWFRKELRNGTDFFNQNGGAYGLAMVYKKREMDDSASKYYSYAYAMNDSATNRMTSVEVAKIQSMYDYTNQQLLAHKESQRADKATYLLWLAIATLIIFGLFAYIIVNRVNNKRRDAIMRYKNSLELIEQAQYDMAKLQSQDADNISLIAEKEKTIEALQHKIRRFQKVDTKAKNADLEKLMIESEEYKLFLHYSIRGQKPSDEDWRCLHVKMFELFPNFHDLLIAKKHQLNQNEFNACFLIRMHFKPADLINMLGISSAYSNKIRKSLLKKLFNTEGKGEDFDKAITHVY